MIEHYLGADAFRDGVRLYMRRHREGNAVAGDLWRALEEASGREVERVAQAWIEQPGFPLVTIAPREGARSSRVRQERFFADPRIAGGDAARALAGAARRQGSRSPARTSTASSSTAREDDRAAGVRAPRLVLRQRRRGWLLPRAARPATTAALVGRSATRSRPSSGSRSPATSGRWCAPAATTIESFLDVVDALGGRDRLRRPRRRRRPARVDRRADRRAGERRAAAFRALDRRRFGPPLVGSAGTAAPERGRRGAAAARGGRSPRRGRRRGAAPSLAEARAASTRTWPTAPRSSPTSPTPWSGSPRASATRRSTSATGDVSPRRDAAGAPPIPPGLGLVPDRGAGRAHARGDARRPRSRRRTWPSCSCGSSATRSGASRRGRFSPSNGARSGGAFRRS